jgi:hypothetical protein
LELVVGRTTRLVKEIRSIWTVRSPPQTPSDGFSARPPSLAQSVDQIKLLLPILISNTNEIQSIRDRQFATIAIIKRTSIFIASSPFTSRSSLPRPSRRYGATPISLEGLHLARFEVRRCYAREASIVALKDDACPLPGPLRLLSRLPIPRPRRRLRPVPSRRHPRTSADRHGDPLKIFLLYL